MELAWIKQTEYDDTPHGKMIRGMIGNEKHNKTTMEQITEEALVLEGGGTDSTGQALEAGTVFILSRPDVAQRLKEDLIKAIPDPDKTPPFTKLRETDYLVSKKDQYTGLI